MIKPCNYVLIAIFLLFIKTPIAAQVTYVLDDMQLVQAPSTVFHCQDQEETNCAHPAESTITAFEERRNFTLPVDIGIDGTAFEALEGQAFSESSINAGSCVNSYLLVFNPSYATAGAHRANGTIRFGTPVIGFIQSSDSRKTAELLYKSDGILGNANTSYPQFSDFGSNSNGVSFGYARGYELDPSNQGAGQDAITFIDENTLKVTMIASYPGDQLRVLTACCACGGS